VEKRIYIRVPEQLLKEFDRACKANYTTKSEVLRRAMLEYVRENKEERWSTRRSKEEDEE